MTPDQLDRIRESFRSIAPVSQDIFGRFLTRLFAAHSPLRAMLPRDASERAGDFMSTLGLILKNLHRLDSLEFILADIGARAHRAGIQPQHFGMARAALVSAVRDALGPEFNEQLEQDWTEALNAAVSVMLRGAGRARAKAA